MRRAQDGTPVMHVRQFVRGRQVHHYQLCTDDEKVTPKYPLLLTTGRILSQYNVGAQTAHRKR